jgi:hypothetical protein
MNHIVRSLLLSVFLCAGWGQQAHAQFSEYEIKAALCYNFAKYIEWPERMFPKDPANAETRKIVLAIYGSDPFGSVIDNLVRGRFIKGKYYFEVRRATSLRDLQGAHIIFISRSERNDVRKILEYTKSFKRPSILTIGDNIDGFCKMGGVLNLLDDYTFQINLAAAGQAELLLDSRLINIAVDIIPTDETTHD